RSRHFIAARFRRANPAPTASVSASCLLIPIYNKTTSSASSPGLDPSCHPERSRRISNYLTLFLFILVLMLMLDPSPREAEAFTRITRLLAPSAPCPLLPAPCL